MWKYQTLKLKPQYFFLYRKWTRYCNTTLDCYAYDLRVTSVVTASWLLGCNAETLHSLGEQKLSQRTIDKMEYVLRGFKFTILGVSNIIWC